MSNRFQLHPDSVPAFNARAEELIACIKVKSPESRDSRGKFQSERPVSFHLTSQHLVSPMEVSHLDRTGRKTDRFVSEGGASVGMNQTEYAQLRKVAEGLQRTSAYRNTVSVEFVEDCLFRWCLGRLRDSTIPPLCEYLASQADSAVTLTEVWVPIHELIIQSPFEIGKVTFRTISARMIDEWQLPRLNRLGNRADIVESLKRERRELQGFAAAVVSIEAEQSYAQNVASELADAASSILRFFSPAMFDATQVSLCVPLGSHQRQGHHFLSVRDGRITSDSRGEKTHHATTWAIDDGELAALRPLLEPIGNLFSKGDRTPLEEAVLQAILLYSKSALSSGLAEKLLYIFAALESLLLRSSTEPITHKVGERLAFLAGQDSENRLRIARIVADAYAVRSAFVHHGDRKNWDANEFLEAAWHGMNQLVTQATKFHTKEELLEAMERHKYRS